MAIQYEEYIEGRHRLEGVTDNTIFKISLLFEKKQCEVRIVNTKDKKSLIDTGNLKSAAGRTKLVKLFNDYFSVDFNEIFIDISNELDEWRSHEGMQVAVDRPPILDREFTVFFPTQDFVDGRAFVTQYLRYESESGEKLPQAYLITNKRECLPLDSTTVYDKLELLFDHRTVNYPQRWSSHSIEKFLEGSSAEVNPKDLYKKILAQLQNYIELEKEGEYKVVALWIMATYFYRLFQSFPYLYLSAFKGSGKTKMLSLMGHMAFNSINAGDVSVASLFRLCEGTGGVILIDAAEYLARTEQKSEKHMMINQMLRNGYKPGNPIWRTSTDKDTMEQEKFEIYSPKAIANTEGLTDITQDRCITIVLERCVDQKKTERTFTKDDIEFTTIRDRLYLLTMQKWKKIQSTNDNMMNQTRFAARWWEIYKPILVMAKFIDSELYNDILNFANLQVATRMEEDVVDSRVASLIMTLDSIRSSKERDEYVLGTIILNKFKLDNDYTYTDHYGEMKDKSPRWLTSLWIGNQLRQLGFDKRRLGKGMNYHLKEKRIERVKIIHGIIEGTMEQQSLLQALPSDSVRIPPVESTIENQLTPLMGETLISKNSGPKPSMNNIICNECGKNLPNDEEKFRLDGCAVCYSCYTLKTSQ